MAEHTTSKLGKMVPTVLDLVEVVVVVQAVAPVEVGMAVGAQLLLNTTHNRENKWQY
jgi:hypothetical protein